MQVGFGLGQEFFIFFADTSRAAMGPTHHPVEWVPEVQSLHVMTLGMNGAVPLLPLYTFMTSPGTATVPYYYSCGQNEGMSCVIYHTVSYRWACPKVLAGKCPK